MKSEVFKTSDQGMAGFLLLKGYKCIGAIPTDDPVRRDFVFIDVDDASDLTQEYMENRATGKLKEFRSKLQELRHILREMTPEDYEALKNG